MQRPARHVVGQVLERGMCKNYAWQAVEKFR